MIKKHLRVVCIVILLIFFSNQYALSFYKLSCFVLDSPVIKKEIPNEDLPAKGHHHSAHNTSGEMEEICPMNMSCEHMGKDCPYMKKTKDGNLCICYVKEFDPLKNSSISGFLDFCFIASSKFQLLPLLNFKISKCNFQVLALKDYSADVYHPPKVLNP